MMQVEAIEAARDRPGQRSSAATLAIRASDDMERMAARRQAARHFEGMGRATERARDGDAARNIEDSHLL